MKAWFNQYEDRVSELEDNIDISNPLLNDTVKTRSHRGQIPQLLCDKKKILRNTGIIEK